jgi:hypothetical protein
VKDFGVKPPRNDGTIAIAMKRYVTVAAIFVPTLAPGLAPLSSSAQGKPEKIASIKLTTRAPDPDKWISGTASNGTVRIFKCKPQACSDEATVAFFVQKGTVTPPTTPALEKFASIDLPKTIEAATAALAAKTGAAEKVETLASAPATLKGYSSALNETKLIGGDPSPVYVDIGVMFVGPIIIRIESRSPSRELAQKSLNEFVDVMEIVEMPPLEKPVPRVPSANPKKL